MKLSPEVVRTRAEVVSLRRAVHRHPELGFREERTAALIRSRLRAFGVEHRAVCGTGTVALVRGARPGPTILIRADMDALPVQEENRVPYASRVPGLMHACGHDGHVAIALGAARVLQSLRHRLAGNVKFMFQPAEEGPGGAGPMLEAGVLRRPKVEAAFALHLWNEIPVGKAGIRPGPVFAAADEFEMVVEGRGGHGAAPHQTVDPVVAAAQVVAACQTIVSRRVDPVSSAVVTFGEIHGGTRHNIIPDSVRLTGTLRSFEESVRRLLAREVPRVARRAAAAMGAGLRYTYRPGYPATVNDPEMTRRVREAAREVLGPGGAFECRPTMGAEDMSLVLREVPGCYFFLGSANPRRGLRHPHHSARFDFDEAALAAGVEIWVRLALRYLGGNGS
ncbi:MAG TPA: amidohydrolase [Planctomycetota bacterium]|nr:amidohydrolase [Planctomycetota bacterium]